MATAVAISISVGRTTTRSTGVHGIRTVGDDGARRNLDRLTRADAPRRRAAGRGMTDDLQHAGGVAGLDRVAVHRRARERRQVDRRRDAVGQDPAGRAGKWDVLDGKSPGLREDGGERIGDRQQRTHDRTLHQVGSGYPRGVISVVIPVHDEERSVALLDDELAAAFDGDGRSWEAVFVDDGSTDGTFGALTRLHDAQDNVRVVRLRRNFGKATALDAGFAEAAGTSS